MSNEQLKVLHWLLHQDAKTDVQQQLSQRSPELTFQQWRKLSKQMFHDTQFVWADTADFAVIGGFQATSAAYVFAIGYQTALHRLIPDLCFDNFYAFCVTEQHGGHPSKITTQLTCTEDAEGEAAKWQVTGEKTFVTGGEHADVLLVAATVGKGEDGRNQLKLVQIKQPNEDLTMSPFKLPIDLPMMKLVGHGRASFTNLALNESHILPGDAYTKYIKPFRTSEDLHILAAFAGNLFRSAICCQWPSEIKAEILSLIATMRMLIVSDLTHASVHIAFSGLERQFAHLMREIESHWPSDDTSQQHILHAQQQLLQGAIPARGKRLDAAWRYYSRL